MQTKNREESIGGAEAARAIDRLGELLPVAIRGRLRQMRLPAYLPGPFLVNRIIAAEGRPVVLGQRVEQLKAALQPVLDYHERGKLPIYVLRSERPRAYFVERTLIIITTRLLQRASDGDIRGIVAHELAHEYVWDESIKAKKEKDGKLMREIELFCDALAAFTLQEIGGNPASYARALERLTMIRINVGLGRAGEDGTHPSLSARTKLNKFLCQRLN